MRFLLVLLALAGATLSGALSAAADPPTVRHFEDVFVDVDPCTGLDHTVRIAESDRSSSMMDPPTFTTMVRL